jgi:type I restriction enzyme, S subunit
MSKKDYSKLDELATTSNEVILSKKNPHLPYIGLENMPSRGSRISTWEMASASISTNLVFKKGDTLFGKLRPNLRKACLAPFDGYCSTDILVLRPKLGHDSAYIVKIFQSERVGAAAELTAAGTKMPRTSWKELRNLEVFCPSHSCQETIASILDTLDTAIQRTEAIIEKLKQVKQGLLHDLLTRGIDANGELRPPADEAPELYQDSQLGRIPKEWDTAPLSVYASKADNSFVNGPFGSDLLSSELRSEGVPVIYVQDVKTTGYKKVSLYHVSTKKAASLGFCRVQKDDVLVAKVGTPPGDCAVYEDDLDAIVTQDVIRIKPTKNCSSEFICQLLNSSIGRHAIRSIMVEGTRGRVSLTDFKKMNVPHVPWREQLHIAESAKVISRRQSLAQDELRALCHLKSGLMDDLLTGRVRVTDLLAAQPG